MTLFGILEPESYRKHGKLRVNRRPAQYLNRTKRPMDRQAELRVIRAATAKQILAAARVDGPSLEAAFGATLALRRKPGRSVRTRAGRSRRDPPWPAELPAAQTGLDPDQGPDSRSTLIVEAL